MRIKSSSNKNGLLNVFTTGLLVVFYVVLSITFIVAYMNGGSIRVTLNDYGEMHYELIFIVVTGILTFYKLSHEIKSMKNEYQVDLKINQSRG